MFRYLLLNGVRTATACVSSQLLLYKTVYFTPYSSLAVAKNCLLAQIVSHLRRIVRLLFHSKRTSARSQLPLPRCLLPLLDLSPMAYQTYKLLPEQPTPSYEPCDTPIP